MATYDSHVMALEKNINVKYLVWNDRLVLHLAVVISFIYVRAPKF